MGQRTLRACSTTSTPPVARKKAGGLRRCRDPLHLVEVGDLLGVSGGAQEETAEDLAEDGSLLSPSGLHELDQGGPLLAIAALEVAVVDEGAVEHEVAHPLGMAGGVGDRGLAAL